MKKFNSNEEESSNEPNIYGEQVVATSLVGDYEDNLPEGEHGPTYQLNFGKTQVRVLKDRQIKLEVPFSKLKPGFSNTDYKSVIGMVSDVKTMPLDEWKNKYFLEE